MANNKVVLGNETLIDLTDATASADEILLGYSAYGADGNKLVGTADVKGDTIIIVNYDDEFRGQTITCSKSGTTYTKTAPSNKNEVRFYPTSTGEWDITCTLDGELYETSATIFTLDDIVECELEYLVDGSTVLPINDVPTWLKCAKLESLGYTTLAQVIEDTDTLEALLGDSNACAYLVRSTSWAVAESAVPVMTSNTTPSGECIYSNEYTTQGYYAWQAFNPNVLKGWLSNTSPYLPANGYVGYTFPTDTKIYKAVVNIIKYSTYSATASGKIQAHNGSDWIDLTEPFTISTEYVSYALITKNIGSYDKYRFYITSAVTSENMYGIKVEFYADADFATNEQAMTILGKYDYACDVLLSDATWAESIANSDYFESVLDVKVPKMTSNTAPSGRCFATSIRTASTEFNSFSGSTSGAQGTYNVSTWGIAYEFPSPVRVYRAEGKWSSQNLGANQSWRVQYSDDGSTWESASDEVLIVTSDGNAHFIEIAEEDAHKYWRLYAPSTSGWTSIACVNFYGRHTPAYVPLVPTMTSNTTPSGEAFSTTPSGGTQAYQAFDGNLSQPWGGSSSGGSVGYKFTSPVSVDKVKVYGTGRTFSTFKIQASNDGITYQDIKTFSNITQNANTWYEYLTDSDGTKYQYWQIYGVPTSNTIAFYELQFYAQEPTVDLIHSAPYDTIYYLDNGVEVPVTTTDINGIGEIDYSNLPQGDVTLYSSVAKDLANLSKDYHKTIKNTPNRVESWLMPILKNLYWFGWKDADLEDCTSANGWTTYPTGSYVASATNKITIGAGGTTWNQYGGIGSKKAHIISKVKALIQGVTAGRSGTTGSSYAHICATSTKSTTGDGGWGTPTNNTPIMSDSLAIYELNATGTYYISAYSNDNAQSDIYALLYE